MQRNTSCIEFKTSLCSQKGQLYFTGLILSKLSPLQCIRLQMTVFWDVAAGSLVEVNRRFKDDSCLCRQGDDWGELLSDYVFSSPSLSYLNEFIFKGGFCHPWIALYISPMLTPCVHYTLFWIRCNARESEDILNVCAVDVDWWCESSIKRKYLDKAGCTIVRCKVTQT